LAGIAIGALAPLVSSALFGDVRLYFDLISLFFRMIHGAIAATVFWFIARPDVMEAGQSGRSS
jgi:hypothetical protein